MSQESLVRFVASRSQEDFDAFVRATEALARSAAYRHCGDRDRAADIVQEVYTSLLKDPPPLEVVQRTRSYLGLRILDAARKRGRCESRRAARERVSVTMRTPAKSCLSPEDTLTVREAVRALPLRLRQIVELRFFEELTVLEVANRLGLTERYAFRCLRDAAQILKDRLASTVATVVCVALVSRSRAEATAWRSRAPALTATLGAAALLLVAVGGAWLWQDAAPRSLAPPVVADAGDAPGTPARAAERGVPPGEQPRPASHAARAEDRQARPGVDRPVGATGAGQAPAAATARLSLHVIDESGAPVSSGTVDFTPDPTNDLHRTLRYLAGALGFGTSIPSRALSGTGPLEVDVPRALCGFPLAVKVSAPGFIGHREATFTPRRGRMEKLTVTLLRAIDVTVLVLDAESEEPIEGALVAVARDPAEVLKELAALREATGMPGEPAGRTDAEGKVCLRGVRERRLALTVEAPGYWPVHARDLGVRGMVTLWLHERSGASRRGTMTVRVLDPAGRPWPGAPLKIDGLLSDQGARATDAAGTLRLEGLEPGFYSASLAQPPFEATQAYLDLLQTMLLYRFATVELKPGEDTELVLRPADRTCAVRIALVDAAGRPRPGLAVRLGGLSGDETTADQRGMVRFQEQEPGRSEILAGRRDGWVSVGEVELVSRSEVAIRCELGPGILRGKVVDEDGRPVKEASIGSESPRRIDASSDAGGGFEIEGLAPGRCELILVPRGGALAPRRVAVDIAAPGLPTEVTITLKKGGLVRILATTPDGLPLRDLRAALRVTAELGEQVPEFHGGQRETELRTRSPLEPGEHVVLLGGPGRKPRELRLEVKPGEETLVRATLEAVPAPEPPAAPEVDPELARTGE